MTPNKSLELSCSMRELMRQDLLQFIGPLFPIDIVNEYEKEHSESNKRDRVYSIENTLLTMVMTAFQEDKSLQNSVNIFQEVFKHNREAALKIEQERIEKLRITMNKKKPKAGRPFKFQVKLPTSKMSEISSNTAGYSKARGRVELDLINNVFKATASDVGISCVKPWHGRVAYNTDGTYFQMQDTDLIPEKYRSQKSSNGNLQGYPQGLLQILTQHGSGLITAYKIAGRTESELKIAPELVNQLPPKSLLLADDFYNCFAFISHVMEKEVDIIVPEKKNRNYKMLHTISEGDEVVEINIKQKTGRLLYDDQVLPSTIKIRRIVYPDVVSPEINHVLLTTILDESISKLEIVQKYTSRWDIEVTIREIKTMMGINIARAKSEDMVFKEYGVALSAYNILRKIVAKSVEETDFSPQNDIFQKLFTPDQNILVDRKGRVYSRWSPGRPVNHNQKDTAA